MPFAPAPDFIANGGKPPVFSLPNPAFVYGWIVPNEELLEAMDGDRRTQWTDFDDIRRAVTHTLKQEWLTKGYRKSNYNPNIPGAFNVGEDHILVYMIGNDSVEEITRIMEDNDYHEKCRICIMKRTKSMEFPPLWFRSNLKKMPKELEVLQQEPQANSNVQLAGIAFHCRCSLALLFIIVFFPCLLYAVQPVLESVIYGCES